MGAKRGRRWRATPLLVCAVMLLQTATALVSVPVLDLEPAAIVQPNQATAEPVDAAPSNEVATPAPSGPASFQTDLADVLRAHLEPEVQGQAPRFWLEPGTKWSRITNGAGADAAAELEFVCPPGGPANGQIGDVNGRPTVASARCPFRIIDGGDLMGSPSIAVSHANRNEVALFSLHGGATDLGATSRSRDPNPDHTLGGLTFTTFTSETTGVQWQDQPYGHGDWGEHTHGVMDDDGNMYIASLWSETVGLNEDGERVFDFYFELFKAGHVDEPIHYFGHEVYNREVGNEIEEVNLVLVRPRNLPENQTELEAYLNETEPPENQEPSGDNDVGNRSVESKPEDNYVMAVWHEKAANWRTSITGKSSWIDAMWTDTGPENEWTRLADDQLIGPCRDASNPVSYNGRVYVACVVDSGYQGRRGARIGDVDLWSIDPETGRKSFLSTSPVADGRPRLAIDSNGMMAITSTKVLGEGPVYERVRVDLAWGFYGRQWISGASDIGLGLHEMAGGQPVREARVTAMAITDDNPTLYLSYFERLNNTLGQPTYDPNDPTPSSGLFIEYTKLVATYEHCMNSPNAAYNLELGQIRHPFEEGVVNEYTGAFNDLQDGLVVTRDRQGGGELVYFAYGDHGVIQYGLLAGGSGSEGVCNTPIQPPIFVATGLIPASAGTGAAASTGLAASLFMPAAAGLGYLLVAKRRKALTLAVKS